MTWNSFLGLPLPTPVNFDALLTRKEMYWMKELISFRCHYMWYYSRPFLYYNGSFFLAYSETSKHSDTYCWHDSLNGIRYIHLFVFLKGRCFLALDWDSKVKEKYYDDQLAEVTNLSCFLFSICQQRSRILL